MKIKICGITSLEDARAAIDAGADYLGFNFYPPSPRSILPEACAQITAVLRKEYPQAQLVGVFVNMPVAQVKSILTECGLHLAQLHGDESVEVVGEFEGRAFKALRIKTEAGADGDADKRMGADSSTDFFTDSRIRTDSSTDSIADSRIRTDLSTDSFTDSPPDGGRRIRTDFKSFAQMRGGQAPVLLVDAAVKGAYGGTGVTADWSAAAELAKRYPLLLAGGLTAENAGAAVRQVRPWGVDTASGVESAPGKKDAEKMKLFVAEVQRAENRD